MLDIKFVRRIRMWLKKIFVKIPGSENPMVDEVLNLDQENEILSRK